MIALLIISLILLTIVVSISLSQKKASAQSAKDKKEWAMKMVEIRKQKKIQREQEIIEYQKQQQEQARLKKEQQECLKIEHQERLKREHNECLQIEHLFQKIGVSIVHERDFNNKHYYKIYIPETVELDKLFLLIKQSYQISHFYISEYCIVDTYGQTFLTFLKNDGWHVYFFEQENRTEKHFSKTNAQQQFQNFLFCHLENRKIKRIEELWDNIIVNGVAESEKLRLEGQDIVERVTSALKSSNYGSIFNQSSECMFENGMLVIDYELPDISKYPAIKEYKHVLSTNEITTKKQSESYISKGHEKALYSITLRTIYETFYVDTENEIKVVTFNGFISSINPSTGIMERKCILSIQVTKEQFSQINLVNVDPKSCFKALKGISAAKLITLSPINPILSFNKNDKRFIAERQVNTDQGTNLAAMHWEDFEQLVRELFELEFAQNGSEVKVTQASRDGGVDAIIFDPDPLRGGKIVIQAKRYTNTVGVSAVRDLYGTVINEGANTGILITTSDYGHDSYEFAKDKPLKLLNGGHLLALLLKNGRNAYINIEEAKKLNQTETEN